MWLAAWSTILMTLTTNGFIVAAMERRHFGVANEWNRFSAIVSSLADSVDQHSSRRGSRNTASSLAHAFVVPTRKRRSIDWNQTTKDDEKRHREKQRKDKNGKGKTKQKITREKTEQTGRVVDRARHLSAALRSGHTCSKPIKQNIIDMRQLVANIRATTKRAEGAVAEMENNIKSVTKFRENVADCQKCEQKSKRWDISNLISADTPSVELDVPPCPRQFRPAAPLPPQMILPINDLYGKKSKNVCPDMFTRRENLGGCFKFVPIPMTWAKAQQYCLVSGANLASVDSMQKNEFLKTGIMMLNDDLKSMPRHVSTGNRISWWLGATDQHIEGIWLSVDGKELRSIDWSKGEPNNAAGGEHCLTFWTPHRKLHEPVPIHWNDYDCEKEAKFVCEFRLEL